MARLFIDGFEHGSLALWDSVYGACSVSAAQKASGAYSFYHSLYPKYLLKTLTTKTEIYFLLKFYAAANPVVQQGGLYCVQNAVPADQIWIGVTTGGFPIVRRGGIAGTILGTSGTGFTTGAWNRLEGYIKIDPSAGVVQIKQDGVQTINFSGNTRGGADNNIVHHVLGSYGASSNGWLACYIDDFVVDDADWVGDSEIIKKQVNGAGNSTNFTPSAGSNYDCVDEIPPSQADYVSAAADGTKDDYACASTGASGKVVKCVQVACVCNKLGNPAADYVKLVVRSGGTDYLSSAKTPPAGALGAVTELWETDPDTGATWILANMEAANIGQQLST